MLELRIIKLSVYYFLKDKLDTAGWGTSGYYNNEVVTFMDSYPNDDELNRIVKNPSGMPETEIVLPIVAIEYSTQQSFPIELGSRDGTLRTFVVSILGREEAETDDIAQQIYEWFRDNDVTLKNYNQGFPPSVDPTEIGTMRIDNVKLIPIRIIGSPDVADRDRREITFEGTTYFTQGSGVSFPK